MRKTALLAGAAGLFLMTAPAFAQDSTAPQTPQTGEPPAAAQPQALQLSPGMTVKGSDGAELGKLEGVRNGAGGQELTVRGADGQLRGVPVDGIAQEGEAVTVGWSSGQFQSAPAITDAPAAPAAPDAGEPATPAQPGEPGEGATPAQPADPATPPAPATGPSTATPAPDQAPPPPGEGQPEPDEG